MKLSEGIRRGYTKTLVANIRRGLKGMLSAKIDFCELTKYCDIFLKKHEINSS